MDPQITKHLEMNEVGDANLFVELFIAEYCYDRSTRTWYKWGDHYWKEDSGEGVVSAVDEVAKVYRKELLNTSDKWQEDIRRELKKRINSLNTYSRRVSVLKLAASKLSREGGIRWDSTPWLLPCENGVVNLRTGKMVSGKQEDYLRACCPTTFRGLQVTCPRWEEFLLQIMNGNKAMAGYLRRLVGYALSGTSSEGIFPVLYGRGRNGKGTMLEVLGKVLGSFATPVSSSLLMEQTYTRNSASASPDLMNLQGKRLVWANETDEGRKLSTSLVKWLCGGDTITARPLYGKDEITFHPTHTMFLLTNHKPQVDANDYALFQRLHLVPFTLSFVENPTKPDERKRDLDLMRRFTQIEDQGILAWAIRGCLEWQEYGLLTPPVIRQSTKEYEEEEDYLQSFLGDEAVDINGEVWTRAIDIYRRYRVWAQDRGLSPVNITAFGRNLTRVVSRKRTREGSVYHFALKNRHLTMC